MKTHMKTPAFVIALMFARVKDVKATCYAEEGVEFSGDCTCHESCATCGYDAEYGPETDSDCITCADGAGIELIPYWEDGTGYCAIPGPENCLAAPGDETPIEGCQCHHTCGTTCGYSFELPEDFPEEYAEEIEGEFSPDSEMHCVDCTDGFTLYPMWEDGSGVCLGPQQCMDGNTGATADAAGDCVCEDNCQMCCVGGICTEEAPNTCMMCKSIITIPTPSSDDVMTGFCEDVSPDDYFAELFEYYLEYYGEEDEDDDEASASTIQTGLAAVTMAVML